MWKLKVFVNENTKILLKIIRIQQYWHRALKITYTIYGAVLELSILTGCIATPLETTGTGASKDGTRRGSGRNEFLERSVLGIEQVQTGTRTGSLENANINVLAIVRVQITSLTTEGSSTYIDFTETSGASTDWTTCSTTGTMGHFLAGGTTRHRRNSWSEGRMDWTRDGEG